MKKHFTRRLLSLLLAVIITVGAVPLTALPVAAATTSEGFEYKNENGGITITGYVGSATDVVVVSQVGRARVKAIGDHAFSGCSDITSITIPEGVTNIGGAAFYGCTSLTKINLPGSIITIGANAFGSCTSLTELSFPNGITTIGENAFENCFSLSNIFIPKNVTFIGDFAFRECKNIKQVFYNGTEEQWKEISIGIGNECLENLEIVFIDPAFEFDVFYGEVTITDYTGNNTEPVIPAEILGYPVTTIGTGAFKDCNSIISITIPESIKKIEKYAFYGCSNLAKVYIEDIVSWMQIDFGWYTVGSEWYDISEYSYANPLEYAGNLYVNGVLLTDLVIPEGVVQVKPYSFCGCKSLKSVYIPGTLESFGRSAFCNTEELEVYVDSITDWLDITFEYSSMPVMTDSNGDGYICYSNPASGGSLYVDDYLVTDLVVPDGVSEISMCAFFGYEKLNSVMLPESIETIGEEAFVDFSNNPLISAFHYMGTVEQWGNVSIGDSWRDVSEAHTIENREIIDIPPTCTENGSRTYYCDRCGIFLRTETINSGHSYEDHVCTKCGIGLKYAVSDGQVTITGYTGTEAEIIIPAQIEGYPVTSIGDDAFCLCESLISIEIPSGVTTIGDFAFADCHNLANITIPEGVISIGHGAFCYCMSLTNIKIPEGVTSIGVGIAGGCDKLASLTVDRNNAIYYSEGNCIITKADQILIAGCDASVIPEGVICIGEGAFELCLNLTSITLPDSITSIDRYAFYYCESLSTVYYGGSEEQWNNITVEDGNECLLNANIVFNASPIVPDGPVLTPGDISGDGEVNAKDSNLFKRVLAGADNISSDSDAFKAIDLNGDGELNAKDSNILKRVIAGAIHL